MGAMAKAKDSSPITTQPSTENDIDLENPSGDNDTAFADLGAKPHHHPLFWIIAVALVVIATLIGFSILYANKIYPGVSVNGIYLGGMSKAEAKEQLTKGTTEYQTTQVPIQYSNTTRAIDMGKIGLSYDIDAAVDQAYAVGKESNPLSRLKHVSGSIVGKSTKIAAFSYDDAKLTPYMRDISTAIATPVANATLVFSETGRVTVTKDQTGKRLDIGALVHTLKSRIGAGKADPIEAPVTELPPVIDSSSLDTAKGQADGYLQGPISFTMAGKTASAQMSDIVKWIAIKRPTESALQSRMSLESVAFGSLQKPVSISISDEAIAAYVAGLAKTVDREGQNAALTIADGRASVFQPSIVGYQMDQAAAVASIKDALGKPADQRKLALAVKQIDPAVTESSLNTLGINELISEGVSYFPGSPKERMQNIRVGAAKFNGVLVKPGEVFSFEGLLGEVGPHTGYAPALVILGNREEYQYGGGMCQVSSTAYRAALLAGLPIVQRHNHSFAVGYYTAPYGVPGVDATVYNLAIDFKFKNDTDHYILIQTILQGTTLKFQYYGTKTKTGRIRGPYFIEPANGAGWNPTVPSKTVFYRDVLDLSGNVIKTDTVTTSYKSSNDFPIVKELN